MKACKWCGKMFEPVKSAGRKGGVYGPRVYCSPECRNQYSQHLFRERHRDEYLAQQLKYYESHKEQTVTRTTERRREKWDTEKTKGLAHGAVLRAVASGKIIKPTVCSNCGKSARRIEGHHHNGYDNPLDVVWLCTSCHMKADGRNIHG